MSLTRIASSSHGIDNRVQNFLMNYLAALCRGHCSGDLTIVYYNLGEFEYIHFIESEILSKKSSICFYVRFLLLDVRFIAVCLQDSFMFQIKT